MNIKVVVSSGSYSKELTITGEQYALQVPGSKDTEDVSLGKTAQRTLMMHDVYMAIGLAFKNSDDKGED